MPDELGRSGTIPEAPGRSRTGRVLQENSGRVDCLVLAHQSWESWSKSVMRGGLPCTCSPELGVLVEERQSVLAALDLLPRAGGLGRRVSCGWASLDLLPRAGGLGQRVSCGWASLDLLPRAGGLGQRVSCGVGFLVLAHQSWGFGRRASGSVGRLGLVDDTS